MSRSRVLAVVSVLALAACSGGGSTSSNLQTGPTLAFSINGSATSAEGDGQDISYTFDVSSFSANELSYALDGGADAAFFTIDTSSGTLNFATAPDWENPQDMDGDNVYRVTIRAGDNSRFARLNLDIMVTNVTEGYQVLQVATGLNQPLFVAGFSDGTNRLYVLEKPGEIEILDLDTGLVAQTSFLDITNELSSNGERGLLGFALDPDFANNRTFYVAVTNLNGDSEIRKYQTFANNTDQADPSTMDIIFTQAQPAGNHNGGSLEFGQDGFLYAAFGDGGGAGDPFANGQNTNSNLGTILRLDVAGDDFPMDDARDYAIPSGNPFASGGGNPEIFAYGLRNPYRVSFDSQTGLLYIADVGQNAHEEIDLLDPTTDAGANFGWNTREGIASFQNGENDPSFTGPVADYSHASGFGFSVTGGYVYRGPSDVLRGKYIFGDFITGRIWAIPADGLSSTTPILQDAFEELTTDFTPDFGTIGNISSFGEDAAGNIYVVDFDGDIFQVALDTN